MLGFFDLGNLNPPSRLQNVDSVKFLVENTKPHSLGFFDLGNPTPFPSEDCGLS